MRRGLILLFCVIGCASSGWGAAPAPKPTPAITHFHESIQPLLKQYCYDCHGDGVSKGKVAFDGFASDAALVSDRRLWLAALKNVRAGLMPPDDGARPTADEIKRLEAWVKYDALGIDPKNPDPGRVTVRRLNRAEYRNTIRDLMGVDFNSTVEFPPDDSGDGFDNNGEVLSVSPLLLEKYLQAAETIVALAVPKVSRVEKVVSVGGREFRAPAGIRGNGDRIDASDAVTVSHPFKVGVAETYRLVFDFDIRGTFVFDPRTFTVVCRLDGAELFRDEAAWHETFPLRHERELSLTAGEHIVAVELVPHPMPEVAILPGAPPPRDPPRLGLRINTVKLVGPLAPAHWVAPDNYSRFFPSGPAPTDSAARDRYAREVLRRFASRAFRRPVDEAKVNQLAAIAREIYRQKGETFETGIARAMMAVLASPRFLFRTEPPAALTKDGRFAPVDEYALASRLSYFLWSSMPDDELLALAGRGELRKNFSAQVARMLKSEKSQALVANFTGQWLQARDVESVPINAGVVLGRAESKALLPPRGEFDASLRESMRKETEACFAYVLREDRSVLELLDSDYTFLNERLAKHYGLPEVQGDALRRVTLPPDSPRGGVLTQGTVLALTSNPTRTSPVKRGLFILENILGTPPPPPPPNIPALEEAKKKMAAHDPTLRDMLAEHRRNPLCSSCHERMDPIGLAFENFTAVGTWRELERGQPIASSGQLVTGENFTSVRALKHLLTTDRRLDYYRCLTEKLLTYALGRGVQPTDLHTVDEIVNQLDRSQGKFSVLLSGILDSPAFQKQRPPASAPVASLSSASSSAQQSFSGQP